MKRFWAVVAAALFVAMFFLWQVRSDNPLHVNRTLIHAAICLVLGAAWAIGFSAQLERGRVSLLAIFVLVTIQAAALALVQLTARVPQ
jgi:hypothetical protein